MVNQGSFFHCLPRSFSVMNQSSLQLSTSQLSFTIVCEPRYFLMVNPCCFPWSTKVLFNALPWRTQVLFYGKSIFFFHGQQRYFSMALYHGEPRSFIMVNQCSFSCSTVNLLCYVKTCCCFFNFYNFGHFVRQQSSEISHVNNVSMFLRINCLFFVSRLFFSVSSGLIANKSIKML